jgi:hypothetical protein
MSGVPRLRVLTPFGVQHWAPIGGQKLCRFTFDELFIGKCALRNSHERSFFVVEGQGRDYLEPEKASTALENRDAKLRFGFITGRSASHQDPAQQCRAVLAGGPRQISCARTRLPDRKVEGQAERPRRDEPESPGIVLRRL